MWNRFRSMRNINTPQWGLSTIESLLDFSDKILLGFTRVLIGIGDTFPEGDAENGAALHTAAHTAWRRGHQVQPRTRIGKETPRRPNGRSSLEYS